MELTTKRLSEQQQHFVALTVSGVSHEQAATLAGYAENSGYAVSRSPAVRAAIHEAVAHQLVTRSAPLALKVLNDIAADETAPKGVRVDAARTLLDRAGYVAPRASEAVKGEKPLSERTPEELRAFIAQLESTLADKAKVVHGTRVDDTTDTQVSDMFD
jgi:phage terminase small subunit